MGNGDSESPPAQSPRAVTLVPLGGSREEQEQFLDLLDEYWEELQTFNEHKESLVREQYRRHLTAPGNRRFVWAVDARTGERIGFCVYLVNEHWYRSDILEGYIDEAYLRPSARGGGAAQQMMNQVLDRCRDEGCEAVRLHVLPANTRARKFWKSVGFEEELIKMARRIQNPPPRMNRAGRGFRAALEEHLSAIQKRDLDAYARTLSTGPLTVVMPYGKLIQGRDAVIAFHKDWFADAAWTWSPKVLEARELGDTAIALLEVDYRDVDRDQQPTSARLLVTLTFAREAGGWRLVHDQNTAAR